MGNSLFGYLAMRFSSSPENLATEALSYILNTSSAARQSFSSLLSHFQISLPIDLMYETQGHSQHDTAIPDLVARDTNGQEILLGEAKFWAGLTNNQPVTYLQRLERTGGQVLILFAPAARLTYLWAEQLRRCQTSGIELAEQPTGNQEVLRAKVATGQMLVLMSWRVVLDNLHLTLVSRGELAMAGNVVQLHGLCEQMDTTAFLPLQSEDLTSQAGRRYLQYCDLVDEVTEKLVAERYASVSKLKATGRRNGYIRYMTIQKHGGSLEFNTILWSKYRATPIWLGILSSEWKFDPDAKNRLASLEMENPPRLFVEGNYLYIPIFVEPGVEKTELVVGMINQIKKVMDKVMG